jgi:hypothetical protein
MIVQVETLVPRRKCLAGESDEARIRQLDIAAKPFGVIK